MKATAALYEPLIERELEAIPAAVRQFRETHSSEELFLAVARFSVLAYAPSMHSKHALLACLSAWDVREEAGARFDEIMIECARYAAESRRPWSEPPLLDAPRVEVGPAGVDALRAALDNHDLREAEAWLARRYEDEDVVSDLVSLACERPGELGHSVIVTNALSRLIPILGGKGMYALLRVALWELLAADPEPGSTAMGAADDERLLTALIERAAAERGSIESMHAVFLFDAAQSAGVLDRFRERLAGLAGGTTARTSQVDSLPDLPVYELARDYGSCLEAHAIAARRKHAALPILLEAAHRNLREGESFAAWSLA